MMRTTGTKYGCNASGTRSICRKRSASATTAMIPARKSGARRSGARMKTATRPPASVPRNTGPAVSAGRPSSAGSTRPRPNPMSTHAGIRYTYCRRAPAHHAAANAIPSATKRYAPAFGTPSGGSKNAPPIARRTAPPSTPRRCVGAGARLFIRERVRGEMPGSVALKELGVFQPGAGVEDEDLLVLADPPIAPQLPGACDRRTAFGAYEHPFGPAGRAHRFCDLAFAHSDRDPAGLAQCFENDEVPESLRNADAGGEGARIGPRLGLVSSVDERSHDRRAALGLHRDEARALLIEPADRAKLLERFPHPDETDSAASRVDDHVGEPPAKLLRELEAHRLLSLDPVRLAKGRRVVPAARGAGP